MGNAIVVGGKAFPVVAPVHLYSDTGMETTVGRGARKRRRKIDLAVWHWTGGEGDARQLFDVLNQRELGVEFFVDQQGDIWQFCDPALVDTFDAGWINDRSVGIEIANWGYEGPGRPIPSKGKKRPTYSTVQNGKPRIFAHFWPTQIAAALTLADTLSLALEIPRAVPRGAKGFVLPNFMPGKAINEFRGHLGHFHVSDVKQDPGLDLLEVFRCSWASEL
jgi:hypothetical protein